MNETNLFLAKDGKWVTNKGLLETLLSIEANKCDTLYIHTSLSFGQPNPQLKKSQMLGELLTVIKSLGVKTICMPTFTFSFPNGKEYNPATSASRMGVLNEYFRKQEGVIRSIDPLMSVALLGEDKDLVLNIGHSSCGENSTFDLIRHRSNVKFLFLGPKIGDCMTYMHYLEWLYGVDYRYQRTFCGNITVGDKTYRDEYELFVRYKGTIATAASYEYEQRMYDNGSAYKTACGDGTISIVDSNIATLEYKKCLDENPDFFVEYEGGKFVKDKTFVLASEMIAL